MNTFAVVHNLQDTLGLDCGNIMGTLANDQSQFMVVSGEARNRLFLDVTKPF